jgi:hypothetical protein
MRAARKDPPSPKRSLPLAALVTVDNAGAAVRFPVARGAGEAVGIGTRPGIIDDTREPELLATFRRVGAEVTVLIAAATAAFWLA